MANSILCPTRGGKSSFPNQDRAIQIAEERNAKLYFLYVTEVQFLGLTASPVVIDVEAELEEMGEFLLAMAKERAEKRGVSSNLIVRGGVFREILKEVIQEHDIETVVLGSSKEGTGFTTSAYMEKLSQELSEDIGVEIILVHEGKVISTYNKKSAGE